MNDDRLRALYAGAMARLPAAGEAEPVPLEAMLEVLERRGSDAQRRETLRRILRDPRCREEFELLRAVVRAGTPPRRWWQAPVLWQAAAAIVVVAAGAAWILGRSQPTPEPLRGGQGAVTILGPADNVELSAPPSFIWRPVPDAVDYRLEVVDTTGAVVYEEQVRDTLSPGPARDLFLPGQRYLWSVTVLTREGRTLRSTSWSFRLRGP